MKRVSDETLSNYLFNLLDKREVTQIEEELKYCPESRMRLEALRQKFQQLNLIKGSVPETKKNYSLLYLAAALITLFFFLNTDEIKVPETESAQTISLQKPYTDIEMVLETFSQPANDFSLLTRLPAPIPQKPEINFPTISIETPAVPEKKDDLRSYLKSILSPQYKNSTDYSLNYFCNLQLNHEYKMN